MAPLRKEKPSLKPSCPAPCGDLSLVRGIVLFPPSLDLGLLLCYAVPSTLGHISEGTTCSLVLPHPWVPSDSFFNVLPTGTVAFANVTMFHASWHQFRFSFQMENGIHKEKLSQFKRPITAASFSCTSGFFRSSLGTARPKKECCCNISITIFSPVFLPRCRAQSWVFQH